jgi:hypothetical protein
MQFPNSLNRFFKEIETVASETKLLDRSLKKIQKAKRVIVDMVAAILFYHMSVQAKVEALCLPLKVERAVTGHEHADTRALSQACIKTG